MLGNDRRQDRKYLSLRDGMIVCKDGEREELYTFVEGYLSRIFKTDRTFRGETVPVWYLTLKNEEGGEYSIAFPYNSGPFKSIVLSLASVENINTSTAIRIDTYEKDGYTKVVTRADGEKLNWVTSDLPPTQEVVVSGQIVKDYTERMRYIESLVSTITKRLSDHSQSSIFDYLEK